MPSFEPIDGCNYKEDYAGILRYIAMGKCKSPRELYRKLAREDLFFLLYFGLGRVDVNKPFVVNAIREVEDDCDGTVDLWAREHYKSTILTYAKPIQELIRNQDERIAIFSHTRPIAKGFLREIKLTLESDTMVRRWFPDVFWNKPKTQAPKWSEDDGIVVRRSSTAKEASIEAWGLVDSQPTSKHFTIRIYDDVVTREGVTTPDQIKKLADAYELSHSLGTDGGKKRIVGTHYHFADLYMAFRRQAASVDIHGTPDPKLKSPVPGGYQVRVKPATHDGTTGGVPVLLSRERLAELLREQGTYVFACQQLLNPVAAGEQKLKHEWLRYYDKLPPAINLYLLCDPANEKKVGSDYTVMWLIGVDGFGNRFLVDGARDKMNLTERWRALKTLYISRRPMLPQQVGYEKYGMQSDDTYFEEKMGTEGIYFRVTPVGGQLAKSDRILRLVPWFEQGRFFLPRRLLYRTVSGDLVDLVQVFIDEEYLNFPFCAHDDMLDCMSRLEDLEVNEPLSGVNEERPADMCQAVTDYSLYANG